MARCSTHAKQMLNSDWHSLQSSSIVLRFCVAAHALVLFGAGPPVDFRCGASHTASLIRSSQTKFGSSRCASKPKAGLLAQPEVVVTVSDWRS